MAGLTQYVSPAFTQIFGWALEEVTGRHIPFLPESEKGRTMKGQTMNSSFLPLARLSQRLRRLLG